MPAHLAILVVASACGPLSQALLFGFEGQPLVYVLAAILLTIVQPLVVSRYSKELKKSYFVFLLLLLFGQLALMISGASSTSFADALQFPHRALILLYIAALLALLLARTNIMVPANAVLLSFSTAAGLVLLDGTLMLYGAINNADNADKVEWIGNMQPDPVLGLVPSSHSVLKAYYPDNPRGYFRMEDMRERKWSLRADGENAAVMQLPSDDLQVIRITIRKAVGEPYNIQLNQHGIRVKKHQRYALNFRARADAPRNISFGVSKNHEPWDDLGLYQTVPVTATWKTFNEEFVVKETDDRARILFDLGQNDNSVEITGVELRNLSDNTLVKPDLPAPKYVVTYSFNSLGCRGPDYAIPRPTDTTRILFLGDSFTQGSGSYEEDTLPAQLNRLVDALVQKDNLKKRIEVINCGISGYDTRQERLFYEERAVRYGANLVVLVMTWNDDMSYIEEVARDYAKRRTRGTADLLSQWWVQIQDDRPFEYDKCVLEILRLNERVKAEGAQLIVAVYRTSSDSEIAAGDAYGLLWSRLLTTVTNGLKTTDIPVLDLGTPLRDKITFHQLAVHPKLDAHPNNVAHGVAAEELLRFIRDRHLAGL